MKELEIEIFTLPNCPACKRLKTSLEEANITYTNKDTKDFADEWTNVQQVTKTYYLPTIKMGDLYFAPNRDFKNDPEAIELINKALAGEIVTHDMDTVEMRETIKTLLFQLEMINRGMGNFGRQLHETREYVRMPQDWKPEPPKQRPTPPQQQKPQAVTKKGE
jgi:glutaredoxin|tara:strand:+ start:6786 stop:7274 length:489 start_codon:yes stop_codon:yes gene_type:complete